MNKSSIFEDANKLSAGRFILVFAALSACLLVLLRHQLRNHFTIVSGDRYDGVISSMILEHWYHVFRGKAHWSQVGYFFPYVRTIAQTDAYFLVALAYLPFRAFGLDPFLSAELAGVVVKGVGFVGMYLLCRRFFSISFFWSLLAAALFTLSNGMAVHSSRLQLATVAFAPTMAMLLWVTFDAFIAGRVRKFVIFGVLSGMLFGAWCLTCFYMAWFFTFFFTVFFVVLLLKTRREEFRVITNRIVQHYWSIGLVIGSTLISMSPFIYAFLPKSREVGVRPYSSVSANTIPIENVLQVGYENLFYGKLYNKALLYFVPNYIPNGEYYNTGISLGLFIVFLLGCFTLLRSLKKTGVERILQAGTVAAIATWLLALQFNGHTGWFLVYYIFPGAKALNVVAAYQLMLVFPVVVVAVKFLSSSKIKRVFAIAIACLLIGGELTSPYLSLDRKTELDRIALPFAPPAACNVFYTSGWAGQGSIPGYPNEIVENYAHNVSAMMIAQVAGIPTINGIASFSPPDWDFGHPDRSDYDKRMLYYAKKHNVEGLCKLDLNTKRWSKVTHY